MAAPQEIDYFNLEFVSRNLPEGMKIISLGPGGQLEHIMWLMGSVPFSLALNDDPALVQAVAERVGETLVSLYTATAQIPTWAPSGSETTWAFGPPP